MSANADKDYVYRGLDSTSYLATNSFDQQPSGIPAQPWSSCIAFGSKPRHEWKAQQMDSIQATLVIKGNLDVMAANWSTEEKTRRRRLVEFERAQHESTITMTFKPVYSPTTVPKKTCVSCIWWEERDLTFITSVDFIHLLESLNSAPFEVAQKHRIRRNIESFKHCTLSKSDPATKEIFKLIMELRRPRPSTLERNINIFPWKSLSPALMKVVSKFVHLGATSFQRGIPTCTKFLSPTPTLCKFWAPQCSTAPGFDEVHRRGDWTSARYSHDTSANDGSMPLTHSGVKADLDLCMYTQIMYEHHWHTAPIWIKQRGMLPNILGR